jgi:hypothetical protein
MEELRVGFVGCYQTNFNVNFAQGTLKKSVAGLEKLSKEKNFCFCPVREGVFNKDGAIRAEKELKDKKIDFVLIQNSSFAPGEIIPVLVNMAPHLGLWAVPEPTEKGPLPLNSLCGMNTYGSIIGQYLKGRDITVKWFFGQVEDSIFQNRFSLTLKALSAFKKSFSVPCWINRGNRSGILRSLY